jgi:hypothetical protein
MLSLAILVTPESQMRTFLSLTLGVVGFVFGALSIKTKIGVLGVFHSLLPDLYFVFLLFVWLAYSHGRP